MRAILLIVGLSVMTAGLLAMCWGGMHFLGRSWMRIYGGVDKVPEGFPRKLAQRYVAVSKPLIWGALVIGGLLTFGGSALAAAR